MQVGKCSCFKLQLTEVTVVTNMHSDVTSFLAVSDTPYGSSDITWTNSGRRGAVNLPGRLIRLGGVGVCGGAERLFDEGEVDD